MDILLDVTIVLKHITQYTLQGTISNLVSLHFVIFKFLIGTYFPDNLCILKIITARNIKAKRTLREKKKI